MDSEKLAALTEDPKVVGLGETGLDYYYGHSSRENQRAAFNAHLDAARETGLPVVVHSRDAEADTMELLRAAAKKGPLTGLIHCFTGTQALADCAIELGFCVSFSGIVTFKNSEELRGIAKNIPAARLLVETDAPYLAPVPNRGKRNEPAFVTYTAALLAELRGTTPDVIAETTSANFFRLFAKAERPGS